VLAAALVVAIAVSVTPILVVNAFRVLATGTFVRAELGRDGFPPDRYGFTTDQRKELALLGLRSIRAGSDGMVLLEQARLPNAGDPFGSRACSRSTMPSEPGWIDRRPRSASSFRWSVVKP